MAGGGFGGGGGGAVSSVVGLTGAITGAQIAADPGLSATYGRLSGPNTWTGTQDFSGATLSGVSGGGGSAPSISPMLGALGDSLLNMDDNATQRTNSPLHIATVLSGGRMRYVYRGGVSGETSAQILARINDFVATGAKTILVLCGANDGGGTGFPGITKANLDAIISGILTRGATPVLVTAPPRGNAGSPPAAQVKLSINAYNHYVRNKAQALGVPLVEWYTIYADVANGNDYYATGLSSDGVHPSNNAAQVAAGQAILDALSPLLPPAKPPLITSNVDAANLSPNGLFLSSSGGGATSWSTQNANGITRSIVARSVGNAQRFDIVSNSATFLMNHSAAMTVVPGNTYRATANLSWSGGCIPQMQIDVGQGAGVTTFAYFKPMNVQVVSAANDCAVVFDFVMPATITQAWYEFILPANSLTGWAEISRVGLVDLTAQGIA